MIKRVTKHSYKIYTLSLMTVFLFESKVYLNSHIESVSQCIFTSVMIFDKPFL